MFNLRLALIKVAKDHPETRELLLPVLRKTAGVNSVGAYNKSLAQIKAELAEVQVRTKTENEKAVQKAQKDRGLLLTDMRDLTIKELDKATGRHWKPETSWGAASTNNFINKEFGMPVEINVAYDTGSGSCKFGKERSVVFKWQTVSELADTIKKMLDDAAVKDTKHTKPRPEHLWEVLLSGIGKVFGSVSKSDLKDMTYKYVGGNTNTLSILYSGKKAHIRWSDWLDRQGVGVYDLMKFVAENGAKKSSF